MNPLLSLYLIITIVVATIYVFLWAIEILDGGRFASFLAHAGFILLAPLWPLLLIWAIYTLIADAMKSMKGNEYINESE